MMSRRTEPGSPPDLSGIVAGMVRLRRHGYGAALAFASIAAVGMGSRTWGFASLLAAAGLLAGTGVKTPSRRLVAGLLTDHLVALSLWWMLGPGSMVDLIPIVIVSLSAFLLPGRTAAVTIGAGAVLIAARIPLHLVGTELDLPMYWATGEGAATGDVVASALVLLVLGLGAVFVFSSVGRLLEGSRRSLSKSVERYRMLVEASPDGIIILDGPNVRFANEAAGSLLGFGPTAAHAGQRFLDLVHTDDRGAAGEVMRRTVGDLSAERLPVRMRSLTGVEFTAELTYTPAEFDGRPAVQVIIRDISAQQALRETEALFDTAFESSATGMALLGVDGSYVRVNHAQCQTLGYTEDALLAMNWRDTVHPLDRSDIEGLIARSLAHGEGDSYSMTGRFIRADGSEIIALVTLTLVRGNDGSPAYLYSHTIDMTEAKTAELALRASEERYRTLFERIPVAMYRSNPNGDILAANPALVDLMGFPGGEGLLALSSHEVYVDPADRSEWSRRIDRDGMVMAFEAQLRRRDGSIFWAQDSARTVRDPNGEVLYYEGAIIDVSAQKLAEEAQRRLSRIVEATPDIVLIIDPSGRVTYANGAARSFFHIDEEHTGPLLHISRALDPQTMQSLLEEIIPTLQEGEAWTGEMEVLSPGGDRLPVSVVGLAHFDETGVPARFSAVLRDASQQVETTRYLEDLVRAKDEFVASVSHELRTPLTAVVGLAHELRDSWRDFDVDELEELIRIIADQSTEVSSIVQDLLVAARADIGSITISPEVIRISAEIDDAMRTVPPELTGRLQFKIEAAEAWADAIRFRQIMRNLIINALRYGGPHVAVQASNGSNEVVITVSDDGNGIPELERGRVFDPYFRAHHTPTQPASVGLGLTVSRQLAELMNGSLIYEYSGGLSTFRMTLPAGPPS